MAHEEKVAKKEGEASVRAKVAEKLDTREVVNRAVTQEDLDNNKDLVKVGAKVGDRYNFPAGVESEYRGAKYVNPMTNSGADVPAGVRPVAPNGLNRNQNQDKNQVRQNQVRDGVNEGDANVHNSANDGRNDGRLENNTSRPVTQHDLDTLPHLKESGVNVGDTYDFTK